MKYIVVAAVAACALGAVPAFAQETAPAPAPAQTAAPSPSPNPSPSPTPRPWQMSGYGAATYNAIGRASSFSFVNGGSARVFDTSANGPMLNAVNVQLQKNGSIGGKIELTGGSNADVISSYPMNFNPNQNYRGVDPTQLYLSGTSGTFSLQVGKFSTLAGAEVIEDPSNANVSRSVLFGYAVPFTHTGARLTWAPSSLFSVIGGINNGWDNLKGNGTGQHTYEFGLAYNGRVFGLAAQTYQGLERISNSAWSTPTGSALGHRSLVDLVGTYHLTPSITLQANYDTGRQFNAPLADATGTVVNPSGIAIWHGLAGYVNWQVNPRWASSLRLEGFNDAGGYRTGFDQRWQEATLTVGYSPTSQMTLRAEARHDLSNHPIFMKNAAGSGTLNSIELQALMKY